MSESKETSDRAHDRGSPAVAAEGASRGPVAGLSGDRVATATLLQFEMMLSDLSARFVHTPAERVDAEISAAQRRVCDCLGLQLSVLWQWAPANPDILTLTHLYRPLGGAPVPDRMSAAQYFPWTVAHLAVGQFVVVPSPASLPEEAARDRESMGYFGVKAGLNIPLSAGGGPPFGVVTFCDVLAERTWSELVVKRVGLVAEVFANALIRQRSDRALRESEARLSLAMVAAGAGPWILEAQGTRFWVGARIMDLFGLPPSDRIDLEHFLSLVHAEDREGVRDAIARARQTAEMSVVEYRIVRSDGQVRWMQSRGRLSAHGTEELEQLMGITSDVTERKQAEEALRSALAEVQSLRKRLENENVYLREYALSASGHGTIVGESEPALRMLAMARKVASTGAAVLITGETGTGKELLAIAIHELSPRKAKTMVKVNCAALPAPLIESELFGREKGAYTGALSQQVGRFELADGSTIFLDEIGDLPLDLQVKLLRVLQDGQYERLGSHRTLQADVRVIAATNRDLGAMVRDGRFREDLFHRLNVFPIEVPPLRTRAEDIPRLVWTFVREFNAKMGRSITSISEQTMERIRRYRWPGNVRELRNVIERAMIVSEGHVLRVELPAAGSPAATPPARLEDVERRHILEVLERTHWRIRGKDGAAAILGLPPTTLESRMKKWGLSRPRP